MNSRLAAMDSTVAAHAAPARNSKPPTGRAMVATPFTAACQSVTYRQVPLKLYGCEKIPSAAVGWRLAAAEICHKARIAPKLIIHPTIPMTRGARSLNGIVCHGRMGIFPATTKPSPTRCLLASAANHATDSASSESPAFHSPGLVVSAYRPLRFGSGRIASCRTQEFRTGSWASLLSFGRNVGGNIAPERARVVSKRGAVSRPLCSRSLIFGNIAIVRKIIEILTVGSRMCIVWL